MAAVAADLDVGDLEYQRVRASQGAQGAAVAVQVASESVYDVAQKATAAGRCCELHIVQLPQGISLSRSCVRTSRRNLRR